MLLAPHLHLPFKDMIDLVACEGFVHIPAIDAVAPALSQGYKMTSQLQLHIETDFSLGLGHVHSEIAGSQVWIPSGSADMTFRDCMTSCMWCWNMIHQH